MRGNTYIDCNKRDGSEKQAFHASPLPARQLLHDARPLRLRRLLFLRRGRDHERSPHVPAVGPMRCVEFLVALEVHVALIIITDLEDVADLRTHADNPRFEAANPVATPAVAR